MWQAAVMSRPLHLLLLVMLCLVWAPPANAWGNSGHRLTGLIAESLLTPAARKQAQQLLGDEGLDVAATYMDTQRAALAQRWPESGRWHYDNVPVCQSKPHCADGQCATQQIEHFRSLLGNQSTSRAERALYLRILMHLLGDIHQPLHMADNADRGGNTLYVRLYTGGERYRLHDVFDSVLLKQLQGNLRLKDYATQLRQRYQPRFQLWRTGTSDAWAAQTHALAKNRVYATLPRFACNISSSETITLTEGYVQDAKIWLPEQLVKAGVRIAQVLNDTLK